MIPPDTTQITPKQPLHAPPIPQKALELSQKVDECKPLPDGAAHLPAHLQRYPSFHSSR